jgi:methylmalonyl-CoA mutase C-terminal domain/subunit
VSIEHPESIEHHENTELHESIEHPDRRTRVLVAKLGLDGHDRGAKVVAHALRDAGMEVIYTGLRKNARDVVATAIDEDVDVIGLSVLSGAHLALAQQVLDELTRQGARQDISVVVGGTISVKDGAALRAMGVGEVFGVRTPLDELAPRVQALVKADR